MIYGGDWRRGSPVDKIRNFEKKYFLVGSHVCMFLGNSRDFLISSDMNCGESGDFWSTIENLIFVLFLQ